MAGRLHTSKRLRMSISISATGLTHGTGAAQAMLVNKRRVFFSVFVGPKGFAEVGAWTAGWSLEGPLLSVAGLNLTRGNFMRIAWE